MRCGEKRSDAIAHGAKETVEYSARGTPLPTDHILLFGAREFIFIYICIYINIRSASTAPVHDWRYFYAANDTCDGLRIHRGRGLHLHAKHILVHRILCPPGAVPVMQQSRGRIPGGTWTAGVRCAEVNACRPRLRWPAAVIPSRLRCPGAGELHTTTPHAQLLAWA